MTATKAEVQTVEREAGCVRCRKDHTYTVVIMGPGRELPRGPPPCPDCTAEEDAEERARAEAEATKRVQADKEKREATIMAGLRRTGVNPWSHGRCAFGTFRGLVNPEAQEAAQEFLDTVKGAAQFEYIPGLFLAGPTGTGKTHLAVAIVRRLLLDGWDPETVIFERAGKLISLIQDSYSGGGTLDLMDRREEAALWVLDDLGSEKPTADVSRILQETLSAREGRPTVITSNLTPLALLKRYPDFERVVSRLGPQCFRVAELQGRDERYRKAG